VQSLHESEQILGSSAVLMSPSSITDAGSVFPGEASIEGETFCEVPGIIAKAVPVMSPTISATPDNDFLSLVWFKMPPWSKIDCGEICNKTAQA
jgi:hypothetical protein